MQNKRLWPPLEFPEDLPTVSRTNDFGCFCMQRSAGLINTYTYLPPPKPLESSFDLEPSRVESIRGLSLKRVQFHLRADLAPTQGRGH